MDIKYKQMKKITTILILVLLSGNVFSQILGDNAYPGSFGSAFSSKLTRADLNFENYSYKKAAQLYKEVLLSDQDNNAVKLKVAECYRKMNDPAHAAEWYGRVINTDAVQPIHKLYYAQALSSIERYDEAKGWYEKFNSETGDSRGANKIAGINEISNFYTDSAMYEVAEVGVNTTLADFSPSYYGEGVVFASERGAGKGVKRIFSWNDKPFLDLYYSKADDNGVLSAPTKFTKKVNSKFHEGTVVFYDEGKKMLFTRNNINNNKVKKSTDDVIKLKMFFAETTAGGGWTNLSEFPYNSDEYSVGHPTLTKDGNTLYFVSDMPGGQGGTDIYMTSLNNGKWSKPVNMGSGINTKGNEMFPFLSKDEMLHFSSDGYAGLGGLDIYKVKVKGSTVTSSIVNLGYPVNTSMDDFGIILDETGKMGYFSSNRTTGTGDDDNYSLRIHKIDITAYLIDKETGDTLSLADQDIVVIDKTTGKPVPFLKEGNKVQFDGIPGRDYEIRGSKEGYDDNVVEITTKGVTDDSLVVVVPLEKEVTVPPVEIELQEADILLVENISGKNQTFVLTLDSLISYVGTEDELNTTLAKQGIKVGKVIRITNIFYDLDKSFIRPDASAELDKIVDVMTNHPNINIAMDSHTDSRQTNEYNVRLSKRRATSALNYLVKKGIRKSRLSKEAFGETQLVNNCGNDTECTEDLHQLNRRTEFHIVR